MKAKRSPLTISAGISWPSYLRSAGLLSNRSSCDGAPAMNRKITCLAFGAIWGAICLRGLREQLLLHQRGQRRAADAEAGVLEEMAPRDRLQ